MVSRNVLSWTDAGDRRWLSHFHPFKDPEISEIADKFMNSINEHTYGYQKIKEIIRIDVVINEPLKSIYEKKRTEMVEAGIELNEIFAFHGTPKEENIDSITRNNFDCERLGRTTGNQGWYGRGVYVTQHAGAALRYQFWNTSHPPSKMLVCRVLLGKIFIIPDNSCEYIGKGLVEGYHSHQGKDRWDADRQLVVFDTAQIFPFAHIHYSS